MKTFKNKDRFRQVSNVILARAIPLTTALAFYNGTNFDEATRADGPEALIVPAGYAFII